jgi:hypothetical protein
MGVDRVSNRILNRLLRPASHAHLACDLSREREATAFPFCGKMVSLRVFTCHICQPCLYIPSTSPELLFVDASHPLPDRIV